ncbi:MAG: TRAP transporter substrate-binding protein [Candidatus Lambdaproteobacteria bacterium]|nr:TRAP transporter substrate-binding protein [Candidatus Lambdaproteobacteria bacterium]
MFGRLLVSVSVVAFALSCSAAAALAQAQQKVLLKIPIAFATNLPSLGTSIQYFSDRVNAIPEMGITVRLYEPGKLVAPFEILDAVSTGKTNAGYAAAGYWAGKIPASPLFTAVPFGPEADEYIAWFYFGNGMKLYQEMYDSAGFNVKVLLCSMLAAETSGWFSKPINSPADLKGLKMRFFGLGGEVMQKLGVSVSLLPAGEIFPALEKKALDGTEFSMPAIDERLGFYKVVKYNYYPGWHQQGTALELLINKDVWNGLSKGQQTFLDMACKETVAQSIAEGEAIQFDVIKRNNERGVVSLYWSKDMLALFEKTWHEVATEQSAKDPFFKKVFDDLTAFRVGYTEWKKLAFLPRPSK